LQGLTPEDLLPLEEYAARRREFFEAHGRYLDRYRRVRLGPRVTLVFENRQTLWFRLHEVLRVARLSERARVQQELDLYNRLLPRRDCLQASLLVSVADEARLGEELARWSGLGGGALRLHLGRRELPADLLTCRPEDRCIGTAHWVQFFLDAEAREALANPRQPARFSLSAPDYHHDSDPLSEDVRQSLLDDLESSDRDPSAR
jgi:hypothetical protein